ncbi:major facilitator superfamily domain-containing protein [Xylogone sp. PMI_703]|nr:major facilitator superfamily domain-containing protein [Xylogone sp. PMI_703]
MQSFLQYRKIDLAVSKQLERKAENGSLGFGHVDHAARIPPHSYIPPARPESTADLENDDATELDRIGSVATVKTHHSKAAELGHSLTGILARDRTTHEGKGSKVFIVGWEGENDPLNPRNWSIASRITTTLIVAFISFIVGLAASADTAILPQAAAEFGVSDVVESLALGIYLIGYSVGALFAGPFSETFGRNFVYLTTMILFMIFIMASALSPNIGAQLAFRFLAGAFGATPLTCAGGSISDMWPSLEKTYAFPLFAITGFAGPILGPVVASYVAEIGSWRWAEWITLIIAGAVLGLVVLLQPETFPPLLLAWKAQRLRERTGDDRFRAELEIVHTSLWTRLKFALTRPILFAFEPIVALMTLYLTVLYIVLFTFLDGYTYIFQDVYGTSQGLTNVIFTGLFVGIVLAGFLVPLVYNITKASFAKNSFVPEVRLWFAMLGAPTIPISLFWMGWTDYSSISIWSPVMASVLLGYGIICIFMTAYMYVIDSYETYAASALTFMTLTRYSIAGGMTVVGVPFYKNMGTHWTLTILGCISVLMVPIPYILYRYGHVVRKRSKYAVSWN